MPLNKQPVNLNFSQGLDTKTDPFQVQPGKFLSLTNTVFEKGGLLQKRNGYAQLPMLPDSTYTYATTFNGNLTAIGTNLSALSAGSETWVNKGHLQPVELSTLSLIRNSSNQSQVDAAVSGNNLVCTVYTDHPGSASYRYAVADVTTGQNIVAPTPIPVASGTVTGAPRVFLLGNYFIIVFTNTITAVEHLQYIAININNPLLVTANANLSSLYASSAQLAFDGFVANNNLYLAWNGSDGGGAVRMTYLDSTLTQHSTKIFAGTVATSMSVTADTSASTAVIYATAYDSGSMDGYTIFVDQQLSTIQAATQVINNIDVANVTSVATGGVCTIFYETNNVYSYASIATDYVSSITPVVYESIS